MKNSQKQEFPKKSEKSSKMTKKQKVKMRHFDVLNMCGELRKKSNKWTKEEREKYLKIGMKIINGEKE